MNVLSKFLALLGFCVCLCAAESPLPKPARPQVTDTIPVYRCFYVGKYAAAEQFKEEKGAKVTLEQVPQIVREMLGNRGTFIDLSSHIAKDEKLAENQPEQWLFYHLESQTLHGMLNLSKHRALAEVFQLPRGDELDVCQLQLSVQCFSVQRPKEKFERWDAERVAAADPRELFEIQSMSSSGMKQKVDYQSQSQGAEVDFEYDLTLSENLVTAQL